MDTPCSDTGCTAPRACSKRRRGLPRCQRLLQVRRLEAETGGEMGHGLSPAMWVAGLAQAFRGVSEPLPLGVLIATQVPAGTFFQALPW